MSFSSILSLLKNTDRKTWGFLAVAGLGLLSLAVGSYFTYETHYQHPKYSYLPVDESWKQHLQSVVEVAQAAEQNSAEQSVLVDVSGAVEKPGVYKLTTPARVQDAVLMAGGFHTEADQRYLHQELNLASMVADQQKLYIPFQGEARTSSVADTPVMESESSPTVNTATAEQLQEIEGIGEKRSEGIIAGRPYTSKEDFLERSGVSQAIGEILLQEYASFE